MKWCHTQGHCCRWDECWIRLLDGMLQLSFSDSDDYQLRIPVRVRNIAIKQPAGRPACQLLVSMDRFVGTVDCQLASITGMELMAVPRRAGGAAYTCAGHFLPLQSREEQYWLGPIFHALL